MFFLGIRRSACFSPNSEQRDEAILQSVASLLRQDAHRVEIVSEEDLPVSDQNADGIFSMARSKTALSWLAGRKEKGISVLNAPNGIEHCQRSALTRLFEEEKIPSPRSVVLKARQSCFTMPSSLPFPFPCWLKRGEACAQRKNDVIRVSCQDEMDNCLKNFSRRSVQSVVVSEHLNGDLVKFYGVEGTDFFYYYYPTAEEKGQFSKFGLEELNGQPQMYDFSFALLKKTCNEIALKADVAIYGGDCIVDRNGNFKIIDFNDWPSFSKCRDSAACAIVKKIYDTVKR